MDSREKCMWGCAIMAMVTFFLVMILPMIIYPYLDK